MYLAAAVLLHTADISYLRIAEADNQTDIVVIGDTEHLARTRHVVDYTCRIAHDGSAQSVGIAYQLKVGRGNIAVGNIVLRPLPLGSLVGDEQMWCTAKQQVVFA